MEKARNAAARSFGHVFERQILRCESLEQLLDDFARLRQEFYGLMMAHFAIRSLIHEAALKADTDPDQISFLHAVRVVRRRLPTAIAVPPAEEEGFP